VIGDWRKLRSEELHNMYCSPSKIKMMKVKDDKMGRACNKREGEDECIEGGKSEGWRLLGRLRRG
jgi:hypothetical protein